MSSHALALCYSTNRIQSNCLYSSCPQWQYVSLCWVFLLLHQSWVALNRAALQGFNTTRSHCECGRRLTWFSHRRVLDGHTKSHPSWLYLNTVSNVFIVVYSFSQWSLSWILKRSVKVQSVKLFCKTITNGPEPGCFPLTYSLCAKLS